MLGCDEGFQLAYEFESQPRVIAILAVVGPMTAFNETRAEFSNSPRACKGGGGQGEVAVPRLQCAAAVRRELRRSTLQIVNEYVLDTYRNGPSYRTQLDTCREVASQ